MTSIVSSTNSYLGESDTILVITQPGASTPYTSSLPLDLVEAVKDIPGVLEVSPEVMTAAVYGQNALYFRGIDIPGFWNFTDITILKGLPLSKEDTFNVSMGVRFANRFNLDVGDYFTIFSTRSSSSLELRVKSVFSSDSLLDDEIVEF